MDIIEITESNYREYQSLNIVAFSFAYEGAMGEMGAIYIICHDGQIYHANYCQGDDPLDPSHINDIIPVLKDISWRMFDCLSNNPDWKPVDLFAGNNLLVANEIYDAFMKLFEGYEHVAECGGKYCTNFGLFIHCSLHTCISNLLLLICFSSIECFSSSTNFALCFTILLFSNHLLLHKRKFCFYCSKYSCN